MLNKFFAASLALMLLLPGPRPRARRAALTRSSKFSLSEAMADSITLPPTLTAATFMLPGLGRPGTSVSITSTRWPRWEIFPA